jgi:serine/threonine-protein kinase
VQRRVCEAFGLARYPVTFGQYLEFINDLDGTDRFEAWQRLPRSVRIPGHRWARRQESYALESDGVVIDERFPVVGISHEDAQAYCAWLSRRQGRTYRLPTEVEWEKAARGPDGRIYPWGNGFDPSFCLMRETREIAPAVDRVGMVEGDISPYGIRDMAGTVREWCGGWHNAGVGHRPVRGGSWSDGPEACAATRRRGAYPTMTDDNVGFRVLLEIDSAVPDEGQGS